MAIITLWCSECDQSVPVHIRTREERGDDCDTVTDLIMATNQRCKTCGKTNLKIDGVRSGTVAK